MFQIFIIRERLHSKMQKTSIQNVRHLKMEFFRLRMDFKKKESDMSYKALPDWVKVGKKRFDRIKVQNAQ